MYCPSCDIHNGPTSLGFVAGPIVNGEKTSVMATSCAVCKRVLDDEQNIPPPAGGYGLREEGPSLSPAAVKALGKPSAASSTTPPADGQYNVIRAARVRVRELKRRLREAKEWQRELDQLERLLQASKQPPRANVVPLRKRGEAS